VFHANGVARRSEPARITGHAEVRLHRWRESDQALFDEMRRAVETSTPHSRE
jgi:hypothetical protein